MVLRTDGEARDRAQMILGGVSLVVWFVVAFGLAIAWFVDDNTPQPIVIALAAATYLGLWMFFAGGIIDRYARDPITRAHAEPA